MTRRSTRRIVDRLADLGRDLGLVAYREVSPAAPPGYAPRTDLVLAGAPLPAAARSAVEALARSAGVSSLLVDGRPALFGVEVEGTDPSSKRLEADLVNLLSCRYPLAALVVDCVEDAESGAPSKNQGDLHRRAQRLLRTFELFLGPRPVAVLDASHLGPAHEEAAGRATPASPTPPLEVRGNRGGTTKEGRAVLGRLVDGGRRLGLAVGTDVAPPVVEVQRRARVEALRAAGAPDHGAVAALLGLSGTDLDSRALAPAAEPGCAFTDQRVDVVWGAPVPAGFGRLFALLAHADPAFGARWPHPILGEHQPLVAFEVDTKVDKHTAGSLVHLGRLGALGVLVVPDDALEEANRLLDTYRRVLPLGPIALLGFDALPRW